MSLITFGLFLLASKLVLGDSVFNKTGLDLLIVVLVGWAFGQLGVAMFFQTFLKTARTANIVGYLLSIWTSIIGTTLNLGIYAYPK